MGIEGIQKFLTSQGVRKMMLPIAIALGAIIGVAMGVGLRDAGLTRKQTSLLLLPADLMIQLMKMLLLPITMSSIVVSMARMDVKTTGKIGVKALIYYLSTLVVGCVIGTSVALIITPEPLFTPNNATVRDDRNDPGAGIAFTDLIRNLFPDNLFEATFRKKVTFLKQTLSQGNETDIDVRTVEGTNLMGLLIFAIMLGLVTGSLGEQGRPLFHVVNSIYLASIKLILIFIWFIPVGVAFLLAANIVILDNPVGIFHRVGMLIGLLFLGLIIHALFILPLIYFAFVRKNPYKFLYNMIPAIMTAIATESSAATIPVNMQCLEERNNVDSRIVRMIIPIGATINMDGTCIYLNLVAVFISYLHSSPVNIAQIFTIALMAISISIGVAAVPGAGGGNMEIAVLTAVGLPISDVYLIYTMSWLMARMRTAVNVIGDAYGCGIVEKLSQADLRKNFVTDCDVINSRHDDCDENEAQLSDYDGRVQFVEESGIKMPLKLNEITPL